MAKTFAFSLNRDEIKRVCQRFDVREEELGKAFKALALDNKNSTLYPMRFEQEVKGEFEEKKNPVNEISDEMKQKTLNELKEILGIRKINSVKKLQSSGLYFQKNVEDYLGKFVSEWRNDIYKLPEVFFTLREFMIKELASREYLARVKSL